MLLLSLIACLPAQTFAPEDVGRRAVLNGLETDAEHCPFGMAAFCTPGPLLDRAIEQAVAIHDAGNGRIPLEQREAFVHTVRERYQATWDSVDGLGPVAARLAQIHANPPLRRQGFSCVVDVGPQPGRLVFDDGHLAIREPSLPASLLETAAHKAEAQDPPCAALEVHSTLARVERGRLKLEPQVQTMKAMFVVAP